MNNNNNNNGGGCGPCGACKLLRRKCLKNCVFAPYFDSDDQGSTHFAAVHKVFGASNASKMLLRVPPHRRLDAVVSLCYEAVSRVSDPVYGCVADIINLQQQVISLQTELAYVRARISMMQCLPQPNLSSLDVFMSPKLMTGSTTYSLNSYATKMEQMPVVIPTSPSTNTLTSQELEESDLEMLAREFLAKYMP